MFFLVLVQDFGSSLQVMVDLNSRDVSTSRGVSNSTREERRGEPEKGRKGEFVNTLLLFKFTILTSTAIKCDTVAFDVLVYSVSHR